MVMSVSMSDKGVKKLFSRFKKFQRYLDRHIPREMKIEMETAISQAKGLVPVDTGFLMGSGWAGNPRKGTNGWDVKGGFSAEYAEAVHYDLDAQHTVGQALFLEIPMKRARAHFQKTMARIARDARKEFRK